MTRLAWLHGEVVPEHLAQISVFDRAVLHGDSIFETILVQDGRPVFWAEHLGRLRRSAALVHMKLPWPEDTFAEAANNLIARFDEIRAVLRVTVCRGQLPRGALLANADPHLVVTIEPAPVPPASVRLGYVRGVGSPIAAAKTGNMLGYLLAREEAQRHGFDDGLLVDQDGEVLETSTCNVFCFDGQWCTPQAQGKILPGIVRHVVTDILRKQGQDMSETRLTVKQLTQASEVFICNSVMGIVPVTKIEESQWGSPETMTRTLAVARDYNQVIANGEGAGG